MLLKAARKRGAHTAARSHRFVPCYNKNECAHSSRCSSGSTTRFDPRSSSCSSGGGACLCGWADVRVVRVNMRADSTMPRVYASAHTLLPSSPRLLTHGFSGGFEGEWKQISIDGFGVAGWRVMARIATDWHRVTRRTISGARLGLWWFVLA